MRTISPTGGEIKHFYFSCSHVKLWLHRLQKKTLRVVLCVSGTMYITLKVWYSCCRSVKALSPPISHISATYSWLLFLWLWVTLTMIEDLVATTLGSNIIDACVRRERYERHFLALAYWGWCLQLSPLCKIASPFTFMRAHARAHATDKHASWKKKTIYSEFYAFTTCCVLCAAKQFHSSAAKTKLTEHRFKSGFCKFCVPIFWQRYRV